MQTTELQRRTQKDFYRLQDYKEPRRTSADYGITKEEPRRTSTDYRITKNP